MITGSLPDNPLPQGHPAAKLMNASYAAWHLCMSLLACRGGATDVLITEVRDALADAIIHTALMAQRAPELEAENGALREALLKVERWRQHLRSCELAPCRQMGDSLTREESQYARPAMEAVVSALKLPPDKV